MFAGDLMSSASLEQIIESGASRAGLDWNKPCLNAKSDPTSSAARV
jgi:hypothetical protein